MRYFTLLIDWFLRVVAMAATEIFNRERVLISFISEMIKLT